MDLFHRAADRDHRGQPLAERMRPRRLDEVVGQAELLGPGRWLRRAVESKRLGSLVLWGPPGTGKTTIGRLLAAETDAEFVAVSAVMAGVKELREAIDQARERLAVRRRRTLLFVDEIHRFNKAQQDALLPHVESGAVILVGATTENPSFEVNAALLSRARVVVLKPLGAADLRQIIDRALADPERGLAAELARGAPPETPETIECAPEVRELLAIEARGDARRALSTLEAAVAVAVPDASGLRIIDRATVEEALQRKTLLYDKDGEEHYNVVSAFIKSMRGSDPDAAVYWMLRMLDAGEDPIFVLRRMVIFASEDVGNADPQALQIAVAALEAFKLMGLPEGLYPLTQAATYLACAPKSNSAGVAFSAARADIEAHGALPVPLHLRKAPTALLKNLGYGKGYLYPHDFAGHHVAARYLPDALAGRRYYEPSDSGEEVRLGDRLAALRADVARAEAQKRKGTPTPTGAASHDDDTGEPAPGAVPTTARKPPTG